MCNEARTSFSTFVCIASSIGGEEGWSCSWFIVSSFPDAAKADGFACIEKNYRDTSVFVKKSANINREPTCILVIVKTIMDEKPMAMNNNNRAT